MAQAEANPDEMAPWFLSQRRPAFAAADIEWANFGLAPRWVGEESAGCAAALDPSQFHQKGADEFARFVNGAKQREDWALIVSRMVLEETNTHSVFGNDTSVRLIGHDGTVSGKALGTGATVQPADGLQGAEKDLAVRFVNAYNREPLWSLELARVRMSDSWGTEYLEPGGHLRPLVVDELGDPVVAVWISPDVDQRVYVIPQDTSPRLVLDWLAHQAIPEFAPAAHRASRAPGPYQDLFPTVAEDAAARALVAFDQRAEAERAHLVSALETAHADADDRRHTLLFGTGTALEDAIAACLRDANIEVVKVDDLLGRTSNADLLATVGGCRILIEVKSGGGPASERYYTDLETHLREWPATGQLPVDGGALIVNHQMRTEPGERDTAPYSRPEFLAAQQHAIISTRTVLHLWRTSAWTELADAVSPNLPPPQPSIARRRWFPRQH